MLVVVVVEKKTYLMISDMYGKVIMSVLVSDKVANNSRCSFAAPTPPSELCIMEMMSCTVPDCVLFLDGGDGDRMTMEVGGWMGLAKHSECIDHWLAWQAVRPALPTAMP